MSRRSTWFAFAFAFAFAMTLAQLFGARSVRAQSGGSAPSRESMQQLAREVALELCGRAGMAEREGRYHAAEALYRRAIEADTGYLPGYLGFARSVAARGHHEEALRVLSMVPSRALETERDWIELSRTRATIGDTDGALATLAQRGSSVEMARARVELAAQYGRFPEALASARHLYDLVRNTSEARAAELLVSALAILVGDADAVRVPGTEVSVLRRMLSEL
jgi:thioredoxin-like negative regulator of GroEL